MKRSTPHKRQIGSQRGFTLLLAALVASTMLALGSSVFLIAQKQITLSSVGRDSQFAFYAADTGAECALYWDFRVDKYDYIFATSSVSTSHAGDVVCDNQHAGNVNVETSGTSATSTFSVDLFKNESDDKGGYCVTVTVAKSPTAPNTIIRADGYSTSCESIESNPRTLQRSVNLRY
jgi:hypothetical protein